jgi:hypothetical protein
MPKWKIHHNKGTHGERAKLMSDRADATTIVKDVMPKRGAVVLEPDVQAYFPDSDSVSRTLRCLIPLLPQKGRAKKKKA